MSSLPIISQEDLSNTKRCLVTLYNKVYDVTDFLPDHPGGAELITSMRGKNVTEIMSSEESHEHSDSAYEMLDSYIIGTLDATTPGSISDVDSETTLVDDRTQVVYATGLSCEEDLNIPTNISRDYARYKFLDLGRPLLPQVFNGGFTKAFYLEQVHRPRHYPGGSAPLMPFAWMEPFSKTPWYMVPIIWIPCVAYGTYLASLGLSTRYALEIGRMLTKAL
jgi:4-hydroxysphinganine ceramide fatty acyl 2-hydroxylase